MKKLLILLGLFLILPQVSFGAVVIKQLDHSVDMAGSSFNQVFAKISSARPTVTTTTVSSFKFYSITPNAWKDGHGLSGAVFFLDSCSYDIPLSKVASIGRCADMGGGGLDTNYTISHDGNFVVVTLDTPIVLGPGYIYIVLMADGGGTYFSLSASATNSNTDTIFAGGSYLPYHDIYIEIADISGFGVSVPSLFSASQLKTDGTTAVNEGAITADSRIVFKGIIASANNNQPKLQVELKPSSQPFDGVGFLESSFVPSDSIATITSNTLAEGSYHWRTRVIDDQGNVGDWKEFGTVGNTDVVVNLAQPPALSIYAQPDTSSSLSVTGSYSFIQAMTPTPVTVDGKVNQFTLYVKSALPYDFATLSSYILLGRCPTQQTLKTVAGYNGGPGACQDYGGNYMSTYYSNYSVSANGQYVTFTLNTPLTVYAGDYLFFYFQPGISGTNYNFELGASSAFPGCNFVNANNPSSNAINNCGGNSLSPAVWFSYVDLTEPTTGPVQQLNKDTRLEAPWNSGNWFPALGDQTLGTGLMGTLNSVSIWGQGNHNQIYLIEYSDSNYSVSPNYVITKSGLPGVLTGGGGKITYTLPIPYTLDPTKYYKLSIATMATDYAMTQPVLYGSNTDVYPNGKALNSNPNDPRFNVGSIADFYFDLDITAPESQECTVNCYSNIMFLPGLMGSRLYADIPLLDCVNAFPPINLDSPACQPSERELWVSSKQLDYGDAKQAKLELDTNGKSKNAVYTKDDTKRETFEVNEKGIVDDVYQSNIYESFVNDLRSWKGDGKTGIIADYSFIPYDWRLSLEDIVNNGATSTSDKLSYADSTASGQYILKQLTALQKSSRTGKVTIVAHSNGGLVTKALIQKLKDSSNPQYNQLYNQIDKIIFVAVPQVGTPDAIAGLLHGKQVGDTVSVMSTARSRALAQNMPTMYNLLPTTDYYTYVDDPVITFEDKPQLASWRTKYGDVIHSQWALDNFLTDKLRVSLPTDSILNEPAQINNTLLAQAEAVHLNLLDSWAPATTTKVIQVAGWGVETLSGIDYVYGDKLSPKPRKIVDGDGTVVVPSALWMATATQNVERWWVDLKTYNDPLLGVNRKHGDILEVDSLRNFIKSEINNSPFTDPDKFVVNNTSTLASGKPRLHFTLHSPLTLGITDSFGRYTGLDPVTGEIKEEIPDTSYEQYGEVQFLSVPAGLQYTLKLKGYEAGTFALDVEKQIGNTVTESTTFQAIPTETTTAVTMDIAPVFEVASSTLSIDQSGDGVVDVSLDANPSGVTIYDLTAPVTTATPSGTLGSNGYYTSAVTVTMVADDIAPLGEVSSSVASIKYSLDNGIMWDTYSTSTPLVVATEGTTTLQYYSVDNNSNSETIKTLTLNIDTVAPTIFASDVSAEQLTPSGTNLVITATAEDNVDTNPTIISSVPLTQIFTPGTTEIVLTATDMAGNTSTSTITVTIFSSPTADPDGDCVVNADDVNPFDPAVFANLVIPAEYSFWEKEKFTLPFSVAGKGIAKLTLSATYYKVSNNPVRDAQGVVVSSTSTEVDGVITIAFPQNTKELTTYSLELTTKKGNTKERDSIKKKRDNETDHDSRHELERELDFASAPIVLSLQSLSCPNITSQSATVNIYDKQQNAQVQYKYKDIGTLDFIMKSDDVIKIKKGQPLVLTVKVTGAKKGVQSDVNLSGNFTTLSTVQEEEHHDNDDRKQKTFTLFYPLSTQTAQENVTVNLTVGGITKSAVLIVRFEE